MSSFTHIDAKGRVRMVDVTDKKPTLRVAVAGCGASPSIDITLQLLGKEKTLQRIDQALAFIEQRKQST